MQLVEYAHHILYIYQTIERKYISLALRHHTKFRGAMEHRWFQREGCSLYIRSAACLHYLFLTHSRNWHRSNRTLTCANICLMHRSWTVFLQGIIDRCVESTIVVPHNYIAFLNFRKIYVFGSQDARLNIVQEGPNRNNVVDNFRFFIYG